MNRVGPDRPTRQKEDDLEFNKGANKRTQRAKMKRASLEMDKMTTICESEWRSRSELNRGKTDLKFLIYNNNNII